MNRFPLLLGCLLVPLLVPRPADAAPAPDETPPVIRVAGVAIESPPTVDPGQTLEVGISGASGGRLEIWGPVTQEGRGNMLAGAEVAGDSVPVRAPNVPGSYELRYLGPSGATLARRSLDVSAVPLRLSVPERLGAGVSGEIRWHGPARPGDMIQIVDPASGGVVSETPAEGTPGAENVAMIQAPQKAGQYQLRYVSRERGAVLRVLPITVGPSRDWMRVPLSVSSGQPFQVRWYGHAGPDHLFELVDPASGSVVTSTRGSATDTGLAATIEAPRRTGRYRMRFVDTQSGQVFSDLAFTVN